MHCSSCGADLIQDARFCTRCGSRVELGSVLGVGTDLPPVPPREQQRHVQAQAPAQSEREPDPYEPAHREPAQHEPAQHEPTAVLPTRPPVQRPPQSGERSGPSADFSVGRVAAMVATFVVLTVFGTWALGQLFGSDSAVPPSASASAESGQAAGESSPPAPEPSTPESSAAEPSPGPSGSLPEGARRCSRSGNDPVATAYSGNKDTSCAFTNEVRKAYRKADAANNPAPFRTFSPVTKRWYDVTCDAATPVRCASADQAAVVYLGP